MLKQDYSSEVTDDFTLSLKIYEVFHILWFYLFSAPLSLPLLYIAHNMTKLHPVFDHFHVLILKI